MRKTRWAGISRLQIKSTRFRNEPKDHPLRKIHARDGGRINPADYLSIGTVTVPR